MSEIAENIKKLIETKKMSATTENIWEKTSSIFDMQECLTKIREAMFDDRRDIMNNKNLEILKNNCQRIIDTLRPDMYEIIEVSNENYVFVKCKRCGHRMQQHTRNWFNNLRKRNYYTGRCESCRNRNKELITRTECKTYTAEELGLNNPLFNLPCNNSSTGKDMSNEKKSIILAYADFINQVATKDSERTISCIVSTNTREEIKKPFIVRVTDVPEWYEEANTLPEVFDFVRKEIDKVHETYPDIKVLLSLKDIEEIAC